MTFLDRLEARTPWLAFPGLFRMIIFIQAAVVAVGFLRAEVLLNLSYSTTLILNGEVWRVFTHLFTSPLAQSDWNPLIIVLFLIFYINIGSMFAEVLEQTWGAWRASVFVYASAITITAGQFLLSLVAGDFPNPAGGIFLYLSVFFCFASTFPMMRLALFGVLPVPIFILALITIVQGVLIILQIPSALVYFAICFAPTLIYCIPKLREMRREASGRKAHREGYRARATAQTTALHRCKVCGRTEHDDPDLEFRVAADGEEYCLDHLPPSPSSTDPS